MHDVLRGKVIGDMQLVLEHLAEIRLITFQKEKPMNKFVLVAAMAGSLVSIEAIAACTGGTRLNEATLKSLLGGNTVCVPAVTVPTMTWQELHVGTSGSALIDYKRGPPPVETVDPSKPVGTWTVNANPGGNNATVTHTYLGGGGSFTYSVHSISGAIYGFCAGGVEIVARVKPGGGAC